MIGLVVCDLDGTLIGRDEVLTPTALEVGQICEEHHIPFTIATGRTEDLANAYAERLGIKIPIIVSNGAKIIDGASVLWSRTVPLAGLREILDAADRDDLSIIYTVDGVEYVSRLTAWIESQRREFDRYHRLRPFQESDWAELQIDKLTLMDGSRDGRIDRMETMAGQLPAAYSWTKYTNKAVEIVHGEATKANALHWLIDEVGIAMADVVAFGDHQNDVELLREAGIGVAVANATPEAKAAADVVSSEVEAEGVLRVLRQLLSDAV